MKNCKLIAKFHGLNCLRREIGPKKFRGFREMGPRFQSVFCCRCFFREGGGGVGEGELKDL